MKDLIDGKIYDTDTAEIIKDVEDCSWQNTGRLILYKTKKGNFFSVRKNFGDSQKGVFQAVSNEDARGWLFSIDQDLAIKLFDIEEA